MKLHYHVLYHHPALLYLQFLWTGTIFCQLNTDDISHHNLFML